MQKRSLALWLSAAALIALLCSTACQSATVAGYVLDPNWYAPHPQLTNVYGTGMYEYGVAGNLRLSSQLGLYDDTDVFGKFYKSSLPDGTYTLASWDVWWRSAYVFDKYLSGAFAPNNYLRLHANMWTYAPVWESTWYNEFGQMFEATGSSVTMVVFRSASSTNYTVSIHSGGPTGPQIGPSRSTSGGGLGDSRVIWSGGEVPTIPGNLYYLKIRASGSGALCNCDPIPDYSDPMPAGALYHNGSIADPRMDLGVTICSDDDGILTNMWTRPGGSVISSASSIGQTFVARGTSLISFCAWIPDTSGTYIATLYDGVGGTKIGTEKRAKVMRGADPEIMWTWSPGMAPLTPGHLYYIEVTRDGGGTFNAYANQYNQYINGTAYKNRAVQSGVDLAGTIMEEESPGSAKKLTVEFPSFPSVALSDRGPDSLTIRWTTNVPADSTVEYSEWTCPYTDTYYDSTLTTNHVVTLTGLKANTMYHLRVKSAANNMRTGVTRDFVACTINSGPNLLVNPGFELGSGASPRIPTGWTLTGMDLKASDGSWFYGIPPYEGGWLLEGAMNGGSGDGYAYQTVSVTPGLEYYFTAALSSWMRENGTWKYDVWHQDGRLPHMRLGLDPQGGSDPNSPNVQWTPRMYSQLHYTVIGHKCVATTNRMTVFIHVGGNGGDWQLFGVDDCRLSANVTYTQYDLIDLKANQPDGTFAEVPQVVVTALPSQADAYYVQNLSRTAGIRVVSGQSVPLYSRANVIGRLATDPLTKERYLADATFNNVVQSVNPTPLYVRCNAVGGGALGIIPAVPGTVGIHNTGLLIKVAGEITVRAGDGSYVFIDDGSVGGYGIKVDTSAVSSSLVPGVGDVVGLSGISSLYYTGQPSPLVIVRSVADLSNVYNP